MKTLPATVIAALLLPAWAAAQKPASAADQNLDFDFPNLAALAKHKAEVDLDGSTLAQLTGGNKENADVFSGIKGVHVRNYEFAEEGAYPKSALDPLRRQVAANPAWSRIVNVQEEKESTQIYILKAAGGEPGGLLVISAEAKEITVVEILGTVELGRLQEVVQSSISYDLKAAAGDVNKQPKP
jgi:hypothetical protein